MFPNQQVSLLHQPNKPIKYSLNSLQHQAQGYHQTNRLKCLQNRAHPKISLKPIMHSISIIKYVQFNWFLHFLKIEHLTLFISSPSYQPSKCNKISFGILFRKLILILEVAGFFSPAPQFPDLRLKPVALIQSSKAQKTFVPHHW